MITHKVLVGLSIFAFSFFLIFIDDTKFFKDFISRFLFRNLPIDFLREDYLNYLKKSNNKRKIENWEKSNMILLRINLDSSFKVYFDPMFEISPNYIAGFTEKYIGPSRISLVKEF